MTVAKAMRVVGSGPPLLLVHGSATDRSTWAIQLATLGGQFRMMAPTRPGADGTVMPVAEQAAQLVRHLDDAGESAAWVVGSSFGAVVSLELARTHPERVRGLALIEPPMACSDWVSAVPREFGCRFDAMTVLRGGEAAAEMFLRLVLTDETYDKIPTPFKKRSVRTWKHIRADSQALARYRPRYAELRKLAMPVLLLGGETSPPLYGATLDALETVLPNVKRVTINGAGHMLHAEAPRVFASHLRELVSGASRASLS